MNKLYREVKASERLPDEDGLYAVTTHDYDIGISQLEYENGLWGDPYFDKEGGLYDVYSSQILTWFEPIEITEEEIDKMAYEHTLYTSDYEIKQEAFITGAKTILSKLKVETS